MSEEHQGSSEHFVALLEAFERSDWQEMTIQIGSDRLAVSRREGATDLAAPPVREAAVPAPVAVATAPPAPAPVAAPTGLPVRSPSVGIFWRAPSPTEPPFVEVGARVDADDTIGIVEVMKLMQQVPAGVSGVVTAIPVGNAETVAFNQPLVFIDPTG